jgi:hypothetical protein
MTMSHSVCLKINISHKGCSENQNTHIIFNTFSENVPLWGNVWKYGIARQVADDNVIFAQVIQKGSNMCLFI